jgi:hypothetical protein
MEIQDRSKGYEQPKYYKIYRSREVGQSYLTSIGTTLLAMAHAFWLVVDIRPDVVSGMLIRALCGNFHLALTNMKEP